MKKLLPVFGIFALFLMLFSCKDEGIDVFYYTPEEKAILDQYLTIGDEPLANKLYSVELPQHLSQSGLFARNVLDDKAILGRVLFYDKKLSSDGKVSCASCHKQELGFADDAPVSKGVDGKAGDRNSIALASVANFSAYYGTDLNGSGAIRFFWDNRAGTAKDQAKGSLNNPLEMNMHMSEIVNAVKNQPYYRPLFRMAFTSSDDSKFTEENILDAIANFVDGMGSYQSKFDTEASKKVAVSPIYAGEPMREDFSGFTPEENRGKLLYQNKCAGCHSPVMGRPMFNYADNGISETYTDLGVASVEEFKYLADAKGAFKVPTLRNVALSAPYMHDGRFASLEDVIEHYSSGIKNSENLHPLLQDETGKPVKMNFSESDKKALKAFLLTLTDNAVVIEGKYSNPFK